MDERALLLVVINAGYVLAAVPPIAPCLPASGASVLAGCATFFATGATVSAGTNVTASSVEKGQ
jgi:hypothetical protein